MANNKKISEITVKASGGDLSGARYIAAVPEGSGFVTKYVQGFGAGSAGGFIDTLSYNNQGNNLNRGTLPNFNPNTQVVFVNSISHPIPVDTEYQYGQDNRKRVKVASSGVVTSYNSTTNIDFVVLARFSKANLGGGGGGGFIDQLVLQNSVSGTLADFDSNTQVVMVQCVSLPSGSHFCGAQVEVPASGSETVILTVGTGRNSVSVGFTLNPNGSYQARGVGYKFYITRYGKQ